MANRISKSQWHYVRTLYVWVKRFAGVQRGLSLKAPFGASSASLRFLQKALETVIQAGLRDRRVVERAKFLEGNLGVLLAQSGGLLYPRGKPRKATASAQGTDGVHLPHRRRHGF